ncbi:DNA helicase IV, partial [Escherichia coli]|nr:DNA helicase IV [Escherichia coli]
TAFHEHFGEGESCDLDPCYRFNRRMGGVGNRFSQESPAQLKKPLKSLTNGDEQAVTLLDESQLDALLNKLSGYVKPEERILNLA